MRHVTRTATAAAVLGVVGFVGAVHVRAGSATASLAPSATISNNCTISAGSLAFGPYDPVVANAAANLDGTGTVTIACTKGATTTIALDLGANASGSTRRLTDGSSNYLSYEIYQDSGRSTVWGSSGAALYTPAAAPSNAVRNVTAYGRVSSNQDSPAGTYNDTVTATVNF
jgi:spore coat protein U-like protein